MKKPELLAPVGNKESLIAAIQAGADAVYLGGYMFGARNFANNFSNEELESAVIYAHKYNVKVYITVNIIIYDYEVKTFMNYVDFLVKANIDALIIQDLGMMDLVHQTYPDLELHASTQAHVHNLEGTKLAKELGFKRVVLARETSISMIKEIRTNVDIDLEIFVHGALCVSYSGQCYMSTLIGERSGNRGTCSQCCRKPYTLENDNVIDEGYLLSTKDLNTLNNIGQLMEANVASIKIEGRMKRSEYVYLITSLYRKAIDSYFETKTVNITTDDIKEIKKIFNREFTKGFLFHEKNDNFTNSYRPNHMGIPIGEVVDIKGEQVAIRLSDQVKIKDGIRILGKTDTGCFLNVFKINDVIVKTAKKGDIIVLKVRGQVEMNSKVVKTTDDYQLEKINNLIDSNLRKVGFNLSFTIKDEMILKLKCNDIEVEYKSSNFEKANKTATNKKTVKEHLLKLGNSIYKCENISINMPDDLFIPIREINEMRRIALDLLTEQRLSRPVLDRKQYKREVSNFEVTKNKNVLIRKIEHLEYVDEEVNTIYAEADIYDKFEDDRKMLKLPRVINKHLDYDGELLVGELGSINKYKSVRTDFSLNVTNSYTVALLHSMGVKQITLSYELTYGQVKELVSDYENRYNAHPNLEVIKEGYLESMITKYNLFDKYNKDNLSLKDEHNNKFKLRNYKDFMVIYNYQKRDLKEDYFEIGVNSERVEYLD